MSIIQHLQLGHANVSAIRGSFIFGHRFEFGLCRVTNDKPVVAGRWQLKVNSHYIVAKRFLAVEDATFTFLALDGSIFDGVVVCRTSPASKVFAVKQRLELLT